MRIGFDAKRAFHTARGLGSYARTTISHLAELYPEHEFILFSPPLRKKALSDWHLSFKNIHVVTPKSWWGKAMPSIWRSFFLVAELKGYNLDVYHGLSHELPPHIETTGIHTVVTIHDLIYVKFPRFFNAIDRYIFEKKFSSSIKRADKVIAICNQTKDDIVDHFATSPDKIAVVYQSCNQRFLSPLHDEELASLKEKYQLPEKYLLYLGAIVPNKNIELLLRAIARFLPEQRPHLVIAGLHSSHVQALKNLQATLQLEQDITWLIAPSDEELPPLFKGARAFCFPSFYEGFGIPVIESLCSGTPVLTSKQGALMEAGGEGALFISPTSIDECYHGIHALWYDDTVRNDLSDKGREHIKQFDAQTVTSQLFSLYVDLCNKSENHES